MLPLVQVSSPDEVDVDTVSGVRLVSALACACTHVMAEVSSRACQICMLEPYTMTNDVIGLLWRPTSPLLAWVSSVF